jgi:hypothetical protein
MGLDWNPLAKPRDGFETEFVRLFQELQGDAPPERKGLLSFPRRGLTEAERQARISRFQEISLAPYETLGAPRVGHDDAADEWLRKKLEAAGKSSEYATTREEMRGFYVLDLLPPCDGFPQYSNCGAYEGLDRYSFRGAFLSDVEDVLGKELTERAYATLLAEELAEYGKALLDKARTFASAHGVEHIEKTPPANFDEGSPEARADILFSAARWCLFWAGRGHGLEPWF